MSRRSALFSCLDSDQGFILRLSSGQKFSDFILFRGVVMCWARGESQQIRPKKGGQTTRTWISGDIVSVGRHDPV